MTTNWTHGPLMENWSEDPPPSGSGWTYVFEYRDIAHKEGLYDLIMLLSALKVIQHGVVYESVEQIRIAD